MSKPQSPFFRSVHGLLKWIWFSKRHVPIPYLFLGLAQFIHYLNWQQVRLNPHCLEAVHFTAEFCIFEPYLSLLCYHTCKLCIHMGLLFHKCIGMGELMMDQTGIQTSAHWNSSMVLSYLALVVESV